MARRVIKRAEWTVSASLDGDGAPPPPVRSVHCRECQEMSGPVDQPAGDRWVMGHAASTDHREYTETVTCHLVARPAPGNPLHEKPPRPGTCAPRLRTQPRPT